ncbi:hypothetical protein IPA_08990 [Ignicoccus pacificus DSM 13166]|uniref:Uncharacterized protein n=1 Tax=Ignicoccus pacificus DSM 13166 TaxID=940294 RepID=A0A977KC21_9CREN|nr:hypothetical protein IPA_08990 [Ignicoccus pacificus DSM 13166]
MALLDLSGGAQLLAEEPFVFVIESMREGKTRERLMSCVERTRSAEGIVEGMMLSAREKGPVLCVTGKHLTPHGVYDRYFIVMPMDAALVDEEYDDNESVEYWAVGDKLYQIITIYNEKGYEKTIIKRIE